MRWLLLHLLLLGLTTCCMAQQRHELPLIRLGTSPKEVSIPKTYWYAGSITSSVAVLVGEVTAVASDVRQSVSQILPEESCVIRLEAMYGESPELEGATTARLHASYIHDPYLQLEPDWGVYRHLKVGQKVIALLHRYEGGLAIGDEALIVLNEKAKGLPEILRRTGFSASRFTAADLVVLKGASPFFHEEVRGFVESLNEMKSDAAATALNRLVSISVALFFFVILCADYIRHRYS
ncbi:hypothetical protein [Prosthecobacter sp.]|uniref:hypothetical protein n=1 Tax=Prosthecobacter sp. TaxID=1965333 RepID=UPI00378488DF